MATCQNPSPHVFHDNDDEEKQQSKHLREQRSGGQHNGQQELEGAQICQLLQEVLAHVGPRQENAQHDNYQHLKSHQSKHVVRERSPRRRDDAVNQEAILVGHIRDILRSHPITFDISDSGLEVDTQLIDLDRCFVMHLYDSNTKVRCTIMHLRGFAST